MTVHAVSSAASSAGDESQERSRQRQALARLLVARGRTNEALAALEPLLQAHPANADLLCLRGNCLAAAGNNVGVRCMLHTAMRHFKIMSSVHLVVLTSNR